MRVMVQEQIRASMELIREGVRSELKRTIRITTTMLKMNLLIDVNADESNLQEAKNQGEKNV
ncbi:hypothetical protein N7449_002704 [Penicillium cf. viridicatum]|uniref:Uncharacterized protein n=1 Tax=Penicillium cf. viridicatum TaxID=2972119 RepID=A0A9W9T4J4_9EURO|nr:hypothetical protein N7449_002704 [Penicillium cf. viridicatum]